MSYVALNPTDQLPFSSGWINTARAAWRVLKPVWLAATAGYLVAYSGLVLAENLAHFVWESEMPVTAQWAYIGFAGTVSFALATTVMVARLLEGKGSIRGSLALLSSSARRVLLAGLFLGALFAVVFTLDPGIGIFLLIFLLGPPLLIHSVLLEHSTIKEAFGRTRLRLRKRGLDIAFACYVVGIGVILLRIVANRASGWLVEGVSSPEQFPGFLIDGVVRSLISVTTLTYMAALWLVTYLNARSLSEGVDTEELSRQWRFLKRGQPES